LDESYTPSLVSIKAGTTNHDLQVGRKGKGGRGQVSRTSDVLERGGGGIYLFILSKFFHQSLCQEIKLLPIKEPTGWIHISLVGPNNEYEINATQKKVLTL
jgi:hypothetical protein